MTDGREGRGVEWLYTWEELELEGWGCMGIYYDTCGNVYVWTLFGLSESPAFLDCNDPHTCGMTSEPMHSEYQCLYRLKSHYDGEPGRAHSVYIEELAQ